MIHAAQTGAQATTRGKVSVSASTLFDTGARLSFGAHYDGIGDADYRALGLDLSFDWEF